MVLVSATQLIAVLVAASFVTLVLLARRGPRVTTIETRREEKDGE